MRIAVLSDTHTGSRNIKKVMDVLRPHIIGADHILHAGDITAMELLDALSELAPVDAVAGNMDSSEVQAKLPEQLILRLGGLRIGLTHGWGAPGDLPRRVFERFLDGEQKPRADVVVFGHSHRPMVERRDGVLMVNPGSPTDRYFAPYRSLGILEVDSQVEARILRL